MLNSESDHTFSSLASIYIIYHNIFPVLRTEILILSIYVYVLGIMNFLAARQFLWQ